MNRDLLSHFARLELIRLELSVMNCRLMSQRGRVSPAALGGLTLIAFRRVTVRFGACLISMPMLMLMRHASGFASNFVCLFLSTISTSDSAVELAVHQSGLATHWRLWAPMCCALAICRVLICQTIALPK